MTKLLIGMSYLDLVDELDRLYDQATELAGPNPNALGFMRGVPGSRYFRKPPFGSAPWSPTEQMIKVAIFDCRFAQQHGRWPT